MITRVGKKYCPYLIRWHWTFLLIISMLEQIFLNFINRIHYFQTHALALQVQEVGSYIIQIKFLNLITNFVLLVHIGFICFALFHAIWGQYFYIPFLVENTELHIGPRPKNSIYSGGQTPWQEKKVNTNFIKLLYSWFDYGTKSLKRIIKRLVKRFQK